MFYNYYQQLTSGSGVLFGGRSIQEVDAGGGTDSCTFQGDPINPTGNVKLPDQSYWPVGPDNTWGPDQLGMTMDAAAFYRNYRPAGSKWPCSLTRQQNMVMLCGTQAPQQYTPTGKPNQLSTTLDQGSITTSRSGVTVTLQQ